MSANNSQLANIVLGGMASYAGAAFSVVMGTTVRVNFMNYRPTADTDGICCEEFPSHSWIEGRIGFRFH